MKPETLTKLIAPLRTADCPIEFEQRGDVTFIVTFITLEPATGDIAKFVGRGGANFRALKTVVEYAAPHNQTYRLSIREGRQTAHRGPVPRVTGWKPDAVVEAVEAYLADIGEPSAVKPVPQADGYLLILAADMPEDVWAALNKWVNVMALSSGGYASLEKYEIAHAQQ